MSLSYTFTVTTAAGTYNYTTNGNLRLITDTPLFKAMSAESPLSNGSYGQASRAESRKLELEGTITATSPQNLRDQKDDFFKYHQMGALAKWVIWGDRYLWGLIDGPIESLLDSHRYWKWQAGVHCPDPFYYEAALQTATITTSGTITPGGNTYAEPLIELTVSAIGTGGKVTITNTTTGEALVFAPAHTGLHQIYCGRNVTDVGATNAAYGYNVYHGTYGIQTRGLLSTSDFPTLVQGANAITVALSGGATLTGGVAFKYHNRFI